MGTQNLEKQIIYQIYPKSFKDTNGDGIGDLKGIIEQLDYLQELGITMIWLTPIFKSPDRDNGYDVADYLKINDEFGSMQDFDNLVMEAGKRSIFIMLDMVFNHTSDQHEWFLKSEQRIEPYDNFYIWRDGRNGLPPSKGEASFGGSVWEFDEKRQQYYYHSFDKSQPDLNWAEPKVREKLYEVVNFWINKKVRGFRFDSIDSIGKKVADTVRIDSQLTHEYLKEMRAHTYGTDDRIITVGETGLAKVADAQKYTNSENGEFSMIFQFELMNIDGVRSGNWEKRAIPLTELKENIVKWQTDLFNSGWSGQFLGSHDFPRIVSRFGNDSAKYRVLSAKMLASFLFGLQGTPYIYQGDEIGMTNYPWRSIHDFRDVESLNLFKKLIAKGLDPKEALKRLSDSSRDNARTPMQWSAGKNAGFSDHDPWIAVNPNYLQVNADNNGKDQESILDYYKKLILLRKQNAVFNDGNFKLLLPEQKNIFAYKRSNADDAIVVLTNFSAEEIDLGNDYPALKTSQIILSNYHDKYSSAHHNAIIRPYEALWIRQ